MRDAVKVRRFDVGHRPLELIWATLNATTLLLGSFQETHAAVHRVHKCRGRDVAVDDARAVISGSCASEAQIIPRNSSASRFMESKESVTSDAHSVITGNSASEAQLTPRNSSAFRFMESKESVTSDAHSVVTSNSASEVQLTPRNSSAFRFMESKESVAF